MVKLCVFLIYDGKKADPKHHLIESFKEDAFLVCWTRMFDPKISNLTLFLAAGGDGSPTLLSFGSFF